MNEELISMIGITVMIGIIVGLILATSVGLIIPEIMEGGDIAVAYIGFQIGILFVAYMMVAFGCIVWGLNNVVDIMMLQGIRSRGKTDE